MKKYIFLILAVFTVTTLFAQNSKKPVTISFHVAGVCGNCEKTIESALDAKGIIDATYNLDSNIATVTYRPNKITEEQIHHLINEKGYDTDKFKATDEQYSKVHDCCRYRELEKH